MCPSDAWSVTPADRILTQTPNYGFNISISFTQVSLGKRIVQTVCPDWFLGSNGPALPGCVCITVMGHNVGSGIQHLTIPAWYLTPANPTGNNQLCLLLKGSQAGRVLTTITKYYCGQLVVVFFVMGLFQQWCRGFHVSFLIVMWWCPSSWAVISRHISSTHHMGLIQSYFARVLVTPLNCESDEIPTGEGSPISGDLTHAGEGSPIPCDLTHTVQDQNFMLDPPPKISCTTLPVIQTSPCTMQVTQKHKFWEDQDSAVGPPLKISCGTHGNDNPIPCDHPVQVQDSAVGPPLKISHGTHGTSLVIPWNCGNDDPIPCDHTILTNYSEKLWVIQKHKFHEDQGSALGPPLKISHNTHSTLLVISLNHENGRIPAGEGRSIPCDLTHISQKCKICEDQDSAVGPPPKISHGTLLVIQPSSLIIPSLKHKVNEHWDLALGPPLKIPCTTLVANLMNPFPRGNSCVIWKLPNELLGKITALLPQDSLLALTQATTDYHLDAL
ncbi:hypothetical protein EDC04DRAFT_2607922 [Pisolithus marmoratus]|nr:hypothetical protein EDC04DRAFT_2607922 [Pisolithus marmoratus]